MNKICYSNFKNFFVSSIDYCIENKINNYTIVLYVDGKIKYNFNYPGSNISTVLWSYFRKNIAYNFDKIDIKIITKNIPVSLKVYEKLSFTKNNDLITLLITNKLTQNVKYEYKLKDLDKLF